MIKKLLILILIINGQWSMVNAQVFTQQSKALKVGDYTCNGSYTVSFNLCTDSFFHCNPTGVILWEYYDNRVYIAYPDLYFETTWNDHGTTKTHRAQFDLTNTWGYTRLAQKKTHRLTFRKNSTLKEFLLDSVLVGSIPTYPQAAFTAGFWLSTDRKDMKLSGTVSNFTFTPAYITGLQVPMPPGAIDTMEYPLGYVPYSNDWRNVADPVTQIKNFITPVVHKKSIQPRNSLCVELKYLAGYDPNKTNDYNKIAANGKTLATELALRFNCGFRVASNLNAFYSDVTTRGFCFDCAIMDTARYYPAIRKDFGSALVQTNNIAPYVAANFDNAIASTPLSYFSGTRAIFAMQCSTFKANLVSRNISFDSLCFFEDREGLGMMGGGITGTNIFNTDYNYMLDSGLSMFPHVYKTGYDIYSMYFWNEQGLNWPIVLNMTNTGTGTISIYTTSQRWWKTKTGGNIRGSDFYSSSKVAEIATGNPTNTPFVSPGWSANVEENTQPSNWCGMLGIYQVMGTDFFYPGYFTTGGNVQIDKSYAYVPAMPAYVQACVSNPRYWNVIQNGVLLPGTSGVSWDYNQWAGDIEILTVCKKAGTDYIIATTHQKTNNFYYIGQRKRDIYPTIDGYTLPIYTRPQATIWYFDAMQPILKDINPRPLSYQIKRGHPSRWAVASPILDE